jgi:hypothetical protein
MLYILKGVLWQLVYCSYFLKKIIITTITTITIIKKAADDEKPAKLKRLKKPRRLATTRRGRRPREREPSDKHIGVLKPIRIYNLHESKCCDRVGWVVVLVVVRRRVVRR